MTRKGGETRGGGEAFYEILCEGDLRLPRFIEQRQRDKEREGEERARARVEVRADALVN